MIGVPRNHSGVCHALMLIISAVVTIVSLSPRQPDEEFDDSFGARPSAIQLTSPTVSSSIDTQAVANP